MFKLLMDYANAQEGLPGYTVFFVVTTGSVTNLIEGAIQKLSDDGQSVLIMARDETGKLELPTVIHERVCVAAWIDW